MKKILLAASALSMAAAAAWAQGPEGSPPGPRPGMERMMEAADTNKDGAISRAEFDAAQLAMFKRMDANGDGAVNRADFQARRGMMGAEGGPRPFHRRGGPEKCSPDANKDGKITKEEFLGRPAEMFAKQDKNKDGVLSGDELPGKGQRMGGDGKGMSLAEFQKHGGERFARLDANKDGKITKAEMEAARPKC